MTLTRSGTLAGFHHYGTGAKAQPDSTAQSAGLMVAELRWSGWVACGSNNLLQRCVESGHFRIYILTWPHNHTLAYLHGAVLPVGERRTMFDQRAFRLRSRAQHSPTRRP